MYLLDTDSLGNLLRRIPSISLLARLGSVQTNLRFTSSITLGELTYGAHRSPERTASLIQRIEQTLLPNLPVLPFDAEAARRYGEIRAELERRGTPIGDADVRIAAIALTRNLIVITGNVRHFRRIPGLVVENWMN